MLKYILPVIPQHDTYIEPFAGGLAVFLAKERAKVEVINDLNDEVSGFYLYAREHLDALLSCDGSDICREIFADFAKVEVPFKYSAGTGDRIRPVKSEHKSCEASFWGKLFCLWQKRPRAKRAGETSTACERVQMLVACDALADALQGNFNAVSNGKNWKEAA